MFHCLCHPAWLPYKLSHLTFICRNVKSPPLQSVKHLNGQGNGKYGIKCVVCCKYLDRSPRNRVMKKEGRKRNVAFECLWTPANVLPTELNWVPQGEQAVDNLDSCLFLPCTIQHYPHSNLQPLDSLKKTKSYYKFKNEFKENLLHGCDSSLYWQTEQNFYSYHTSVISVIIIIL